jgi:hypothetical protein
MGLVEKGYFKIVEATKFEYIPRGCKEQAVLPAYKIRITKKISSSKLAKLARNGEIVYSFLLDDFIFSNLSRAHRKYKPLGIKPIDGKLPKYLPIGYELVLLMSPVPSSLVSRPTFSNGLKSIWQDIDSIRYGDNIALVPYRPEKPKLDIKPWQKRKAVRRKKKMKGNRNTKWIDQRMEEMEVLTQNSGLKKVQDQKEYDLTQNLDIWDSLRRLKQ